MSAVPNQVTFMFDCFGNPDGTIDMELRKATTRLGKWVIDTRDAAIREKLIQMGWTPPEKKPFLCCGGCFDSGHRPTCEHAIDDAQKQEWEDSIS